MSESQQTNICNYEQVDIQSVCKETIYVCNNSKNICDASSSICVYMTIFNASLYFLYTIHIMKIYGFFENYEIDINEKLYDFIWKLLKVYSLVNSKFEKFVIIPLNSARKNIYKHLKCYIENPPHKFIVVRNGKEIMKFEKLNGLLAYYIFNKDVENDDLICNRTDNMVYYTKVDDFFYGNPVFDNDNYHDNSLEQIEISSIKFMTCHVTLNVKNKDKNNIFIQREIVLDEFMLVSNKILSKSFVMWYCNKYFGIDIDSIESYKIDIIDQDIDQIQIDMNDYIEIYKDDYLIHKNKNNIKNINQYDDDCDTPVNELDKIITNLSNDGDVNSESCSVNNNRDENTSYVEQDDSQNECDSSTETSSENNNTERNNEVLNEIIQKIINDIEEKNELSNQDDDSSDCEYHRDLENDTEHFNESINNNLSSSWMPSFMLF